MKKIKLIKDNELMVTVEDNSCDFCGEESKCFTSSWEGDCRKCASRCVMQICENCVLQLNKLIKVNTKK